MTPILTFAGRKFVCQCSFDQREIPKAAGFRWDPTRKCWWTDDPQKANGLVEYADDGAKAEMIRRAADSSPTRPVTRSPTNLDPSQVSLAHLLTICRTPDGPVV